MTYASKDIMTQVHVNDALSQHSALPKQNAPLLVSNHSSLGRFSTVDPAASAFPVPTQTDRPTPA